MAEECVFCRIVSGEVPCDEVARGPGWIAFKDLNPQAPTHVLVIPERHIERLSDVAGRERELLGTIVAAATSVAAGIPGCGEDYRLVWNCGPRAGQSVWHIHLHLLGGRPFGWPPG